VPSNDIGLNIGLRIAEVEADEDGALNVTAEIEVLQERVMRSLRVSPEVLRGIREGSLSNISMGCSVGAPAPCPECLPEAIPTETRDRILREYINSSPGRPRLAAAGAPAIRSRLTPSPWHPEFGSNVEQVVREPDSRLIDISLVGEGEGHPFRVIKPLPSWCKEGAIVRRYEDDEDYSVILVGGEDIWFRANDNSPAPLQVVIKKDELAENWQHEWRPHPLPLTKWERLLQD